MRNYKSSLLSDWNSYLKELTYTCPEGSVLEYPNVTDEQVSFASC